MIYKLIRGAVLGMLLGICFGLFWMGSQFLLQGGSVRDLAAMFQTGELQEAFFDTEKGRVSAEVYEDAVKSPEDVVIRFHVRANSDSETDLELKYKVRDAVLQLLSEDLSKAENDSEAMLYLSQHLGEIRETARAVVDAEGYEYEVTAYVTTEEFPIREYGTLVLPAGVYRALRIDIGEARGENFWCMLYPMMCYTMDAGAVVDSGDAEKLEGMLEEEEYEKLFVKRECEKGDVKIKFKLVEWLQDTF